MTRAASAEDTDFLRLPGTPLAEAIVGLIRPVETRSVFNHSIRTYLFARFVAGRLGLAAGADYDDDLLFAASTMHDLGVAADGAHRSRFEVEGADRAARFLSEHGVSASEADEVWQAIALHTSPGIAERPAAPSVCWSAKALLSTSAARSAPSTWTLSPTSRPTPCTRPIRVWT